MTADKRGAGECRVGRHFSGILRVGIHLCFISSRMYVFVCAESWVAPDWSSYVQATLPPSPTFIACGHESDDDGSVGRNSTSTMPWASWAKGGEVEAGGAEGGGDDGQWKLLLQSGKSKGKDVVHRLSNLREVTENGQDKSVTLLFEGGGEPNGKITAVFPPQQPAAMFFRQVK